MERGPTCLPTAFRVMFDWLRPSSKRKVYCSNELVEYQSSDKTVPINVEAIAHNNIYRSVSSSFTPTRRLQQRRGDSSPQSDSTCTGQQLAAIKCKVHVVSASQV